MVWKGQVVLIVSGEDCNDAGLFDRLMREVAQMRFIKLRV